MLFLSLVPLAIIMADFMPNNEVIGRVTVIVRVKKDNLVIG